MKTHLVVATILSVCASANASGQANWAGQPVPTELETGVSDPHPTSFNASGSTFTPRPQLDGGEYVDVICVASRPAFTCANGSPQGVGRVPISAFARAADVQTLQNQMAHVEDRANRATAVASALDAVAPAPNATYRLGFNIGSSEGESALGLSFAGRSGSFDFNLAGAVGSGTAAGKVGAGISW